MVIISIFESLLCRIPSLLPRRLEEISYLAPAPMVDLRSWWMFEWRERLGALQLWGRFLPRLVISKRDSKTSTPYLRFSSHIEHPIRTAALSHIHLHALSMQLSLIGNGPASPACVSRSGPYRLLQVAMSDLTYSGLLM